MLRGEMEMWNNNKIMKGLIIITTLCSNLSETSDSIAIMRDRIVQFKFEHKNKSIEKTLFVTR